LPCMSTILSMFDNTMDRFIRSLVAEVASNGNQISIINENEPNELHFST
jgi:hypothetical protein